MSTLDRAIQIATKAHAGQTRRNGEPSPIVNQAYPHLQPRVVSGRS
jgi:hypothetical protein